MRQLNDISRDRDAMGTIVELTSAFEGIASMNIAQIKDQVQSSEQFFGELWRIYKQIRVDRFFHFGRSATPVNVIDKELLILITAQGSFSGDIDQKLIDQAIKYYRTERNDIIIVGHHGAVQLAQMDIKVVKSFSLPLQDRNINVMPLVAEVQKYTTTMIYYQAYVSLTNQDVRRIKLATAVAERGKNVEPGEEVISEQNYIFEPSTREVVDHLERSMMQITLSEVILESKLAQYASRFRAMRAAHDKSDDSFADLSFLYNRAKRHIKDERLKEVINSLRQVRR